MSSTWLWEWVVDQGDGNAPSGVSVMRDRAMTALSRTLIAASAPASGRVVPIVIVDGAFGVCYRRLSPGLRADSEGRRDHVVFIDSSGEWWRPASDDPADIDLTVPSPARVYDYYLGGKDHFPADREAAEQALSVVPSGRELARANRDFLVRAVSIWPGRALASSLTWGPGCRRARCA